MASTWSNLGLRLMATGENDNTWGAQTNDNWNRMEDSTDGYMSVALSSTSHTATFTTQPTSYADEEGRQRVINYTGSPGGTCTVTLPNIEKVYVIMGNHDLFYREKREINSMEFIRNIPNIHLVNEWIVEDDVAIIPWIVGDEYKKIEKMQQKYVFGHFELPYFKMNAMVEMPDVGGIKTEHFANCGMVFTGHFHKRQMNENVTYMGNAFPHNYADAWDDKRGMMILDKENNKEPVYIDWDDCPKYRTLKLSKLLDEKEKLLKSKMYLRVTLDLPISYEEASFIKETFVNEYDCREITLIPQKQIEEISTELDISKFESVDEIVSKEISAIDSDNFNKKMLLDIYNEL